MADFVQLVVIDPRSPYRGLVLDRWESYEFVNDLFTPADHFKFTLRVGARADAVSAADMRRAREAVGEETVVQLRAKGDGTVLATGIVDDVYAGGSRDGGPVLEISGRDCMGVFQDNFASQALRVSGLTLGELADKVASRYRGKGIPFNILTDNESNRDVMTGKKRPLQKRQGAVSLREVKTANGTVRAPNQKSRPDKVPSDFVRYPIAEARPHGGETEYVFLDRHARNLGVMMWTSTGGDIVLSRPNYDQQVLYTLQRTIRGPVNNNILEGGQRRNRGNSATKVRMLGHTSGKGDFKQQIRAEASVEPDTFVWPRERIIHDGNAKDQERARREAQRALARHNVNIESLEYVLLDYSQGGKYYSPDTLAFVNDEWSGAYGVYYIVARIFTKNRVNGARVSLRLIPKGAYILD